MERPRHPTGRARRRWPRAYDGGSPELPTNHRYVRDYERDRPLVERRSGRRRSMLDELRQSPIRNGLIGLAVAGTAAPMAINHYQQAMRTDPTHEHMIARMSPVSVPVSDAGVSRTWQAMEAGRSEKVAARESTIAEKIAQYANYGLTHELASAIYDAADSSNVSPDVAFGLVHAESSFKTSATSHVGAIGLTQLMPATARWLKPGTTVSDLRNPETNLQIGFGYLRKLIDRYDGNENLALLAYNRGPGTVDKVLKRGGNPDNGYAKFVKTGNVGRHKG